MLKTHKDEEWNNLLSTLNINDGSAYNLYRKLINKPTPNNPLTSIHNLLYKANEKAEAFVDTYEQQSVANHGIPLPEVDLSV